MAKSEILMKYVEKIIKSRDPNKILELDISGLNYENNIEYSDLVSHWKLNKDDLITKEYKIINEPESPKMMGLFSMFYLKDKNNFLTVGKYNGELFHLDIKCDQYQRVLNKAMESNNTVFILSYWMF